jgi:hypothetical protein
MAKTEAGFRVPQESEPVTLRPKHFLPTCRTIHRGRLGLVQRPTEKSISKALGRSDCQRLVPFEDLDDHGSENSASVFRPTSFVAYPSDCYLGTWRFNHGEVRWKSAV